MSKSVVAEGPSARPVSSPPSTCAVLPQDRTLLSPLDAWQIRPYNIDRNHRADFDANTNRTVDGGDDGGSCRDGFVGMMAETSSSAFTHGSPALFRYLPHPPSPTSQTFSLPSPLETNWLIDRLQQDLGAESEEQQRVKARAATSSGTSPAGASRRYSEQDIRTRTARASLHKHKGRASSDPIYSPSRCSNLHSSSPPFLPFGVSIEMEHQLQVRHGYSSSIGSRSSFGSGSRSPLSSNNPSNYGSSRTSLSSTLSVSSIEVNARMPKVVRPNYTDPMAAPFTMYGYGRPTQRPLLIPQRLGGRQSSYTSQSFGKSYQRRVPGEAFKKLPEEVLLNILVELRKSHLEQSSLSCSTCCMRDLISIGASCRKWSNAASVALYEDIQLIGEDSHSHIKKRFKMKYGSRLKLLRRTLQSRPDLAEYVKSLKVPAIPISAKSQKDQEEYMDLVASVIMACPNLERLPGMYPAYKHEFSKFVHALSTRKHLQERVWIISSNSSKPQYKLNISEDAEYLTPILVPNFLPPDQCTDFLNLHSNWNGLKTLVLHCNPEGTMNSALFLDIFASLPSLENLHLSSFPAAVFNDRTLMSVPSLKSLRLESLPGITDDGLSNFASQVRTDRLKCLSLISLSLHSLPVLARLFSHLRSLTDFTLSQAQSPPGVDCFLYPYLASQTLQTIHWEFTSPDDDRASEILSKSISTNGFPKLTKIRAPTDFDGSLQKLCRTRDRIELPGDKYRNIGIAGPSRLPSSQSMPTLPSLLTRSSFGPSHSYNNSLSSTYVKSPTRSAFSLNMETRSNSSDVSNNSREKGMSLAVARRLAQHRAEAAKSKSKFHIIIWDENGDFLERHAVGGYLGKLQSQIDYVLHPDLEGSDDSLIGIEALLDGSEETNVRDGCTGSWHADIIRKGPVVSAKKGKERWVHTERGRWKDIDVHRLF
ncbi:RNI-like protein [Glarea lozoyensis ATCC 20868]|uniref:RNI-like protein n=1 Tax=Glarea lozoyensis (strain ATCC 20868 / MF5171) TaxID=1116229 RepID=S3CEZ6_GLAL2|nr:RNI-like protein [Glarea lozoyensis ATCC 20868]EPE25072.1 RNI-like protein [Glarea lozoyensis ATCC 20868]